MPNLAIQESTELAPQADYLARFADFLRLDVANGDASPATVRTYFAQVRQWVAWCEENGVNPGTATTEDVKRYRQALIEAGLARATVATRLTVLRRFYAMLQAHGLRRDNPAEGVKAPPDRTDPTERIKWLPAEAVTRLLNAPGEDAKGRRDKALLALMALHGLRVAEVASLDLEDVDLDGLTVHVLGKGKKRRTVPLIPETVAILRAWLRVRDEIAAPGETALFVNLKSPRPEQAHRRMSTRGIRAVVDGYLEALGLKKEGISCHALRHSYATLSRAAGARLDAISRTLGHASVTTTQVYADIVDIARENPARYLAEILGWT